MYQSAPINNFDKTFCKFKLKMNSFLLDHCWNEILSNPESSRGKFIAYPGIQIRIIFSPGTRTLQFRMARAKQYG